MGFENITELYVMYLKDRKNYMPYVDVLFVLT